MSALQVQADASATKVTIRGDGVRLACYSRGNAAQPTIVFVHGYPDTHRVWSRMVDALQGDFHCVTYDVRGAGASERPRPRRAYRVGHLAADLAAVVVWASPERPVHLVGHDWGSIQAWEAVTDAAVAERIASFTTISGPCLDHVGFWLRQRWRGDRLALLGQLRKSWYIGLFHMPGATASPWHRMLARRWPAMTRRLEGEAAPSCATRAVDAAHGVKLYRANILPRLRAPRERRTRVPVQVLTPRDDPFLGPGLTDGLGRWVTHLEVRAIDGGHWAVHTRADTVADCCRAFIESLDDEPHPAPRAARRQATSAPTGARP